MVIAVNELNSKPIPNLRLLHSDGTGKGSTVLKDVSRCYQASGAIGGKCRRGNVFCRAAGERGPVSAG